MERKSKLKLTLVAILVIAGLTAVAFYPQIQQTTTVKERVATWKALGDYDPGAGAGGFIRIVIKALPDGSSTNPNTNASLATNLTYIENNAFFKEIPHSTKFGIYIVARFNATEAYSVTNTTWVQAWVRCYITGLNCSITADTLMNKTLMDTAGAVYMWECFYLELNASSQPLMLLRDQYLDLSSIKLEAYY